MKGELINKNKITIGIKEGYFMTCVDCNTDFFVNILGETIYNGVVIKKCPWCREDSKP